MNLQPATTKDYLQLHFIVLLFGFTAILGELVEIPAVELVFYRVLLSCPFLWLLMRYRKVPFRVPTRALLTFLSTGLIVAAHWILFFLSTDLGTISVTLAGIATTSFWTSLLEPWLKKRRLRVYELVLGLVVIGGLYLIFLFEFNNALGLALAIGAALLAALFSVLNSKYTHHYNPYVITYYEMIGATLGILLFFPLYAAYLAPAGQITWLPAQSFQWVYIGLLALACTVYAFSVSVEIMKRISAFAVNLTINLEPVYGIILALILFGEKEQMQPGFYLGTLVILGSVLSYPVLNRMYRRKYLSTDILR